jgi:hypothetical protein
MALKDALSRWEEHATPRRVQWAAALAAFVVIGWLFQAYAMSASRVIDGERWFWLDDDQMISMRYARHLAEGHGLVWNPGERVEGYTNFLWTLIMAVPHTSGVALQRTALVMEGLNALLCCGLVVLALRMLRCFVPDARLAAVAVAACVVTCYDIVLWAAAGFETALLTVLYLLFLTELLRRGDTVIGYLALSLIPLARGDGLHIFAGAALLALYLSNDRRRTVTMLAVALLPAVGHQIFRLAYYGEWLPNTYHLKAGDLPNKHRHGYNYVRKFAVRHAVLLCLAIGAMIGLRHGEKDGKRDRRWAVLATSFGATAVYSVVVGGDNFGGARFFSHALPVLFVFAAVGAAVVAERHLAQVVWLSALVVSSVPLQKSAVRPLTTARANGDPAEQVVVAALLDKNASPDSSIVVFPAGIATTPERLLDARSPTSRSSDR